MKNHEKKQITVLGAWEDTDDGPRLPTCWDCGPFMAELDNATVPALPRTYPMQRPYTVASTSKSIGA